MMLYLSSAPLIINWETPLELQETKTHTYLGVDILHDLKMEYS